jgi:hypothetical protein
VKALDTWHKTRAGLLTFALVELLLAYGAASWAIDSGNILLYIMTIVLIIGGLQNLIKLVIALLHGSRQAS